MEIKVEQLWDLILEEFPQPELPMDKPVPSLPGLKRRREGQGLSDRLRNTIIVGGSLVVLGGAAAYVASQDIPGQIAEWFTSEAPTPTAFDSSVNKSSVENGINAVTVLKTDLLKEYVEQSAQNKDSKNPTAIFPVIFTAPGQRVDYEYQKPFIAGTDSQTGQPVTIEKPGTIHAKFNKGEEIPVPVENAEIFQFPPRIIDGKQYFVGVWMKFQQNGETFAFGISADDVRTFIPIGEVVNAPLVPVNEGGTLLFSNAKNGLKLPFTTPVIRVNIETNLSSGFSFSRYNPETGRWESKRPNFVTDKSTGQSKLMLPQNNN